MALLWTASAPNLPFPRNVSGGLWYTLANVEILLINSSKRAPDIELLCTDIGGLSDKTTALWLFIQQLFIIYYSSKTDYI